MIVRNEPLGISNTTTSGALLERSKQAATLDGDYVAVFPF